MASTETTRSLRELARILFSRWLGIVLILVVVIGGVWGATMLSNWRYRSRAMLMARPLAPMASLEGGANIKDRLSLFIVNQREMIEGDYVIAAALEKLDGAAPDGYEGLEKDNKKDKWYKDETLQEFIERNATRVNEVRKRVSVETPGGPDVTSNQTFYIVVDWPEERDRAAGQAGSSRAVAAERAQTFAKYIVGAYLARRGELERRHAQSSLDFLEKTDSAKKNLQDASDTLEKFIRDDLGGDMLLVENMLGGIGEVGVLSIRTRLEGEMREARARQAEIAALVAEIDKQIKGPPDKMAVPEVVLRVNPGLMRVVDAIVGLKIKINALVPQYTEDYKGLKEARQELASNQAFLGDELSKQQEMLRMEAAVLDRRMAEVDVIVKAETARVNELASKASTYQKLKDSFAKAQSMYNQSREEILSAQRTIALADTSVEVNVREPPSRPSPDSPHRPLVWVNLLIGVLAALLLALIYAFMADHLDHAVKSIDDVETYVQTEVLASIPKYRRRVIRAK